MRQPLTPEQQAQFDERLQLMWINAPRITSAQMYALERSRVLREYVPAKHLAYPDDNVVPVMLSDRNDEPFYLLARDVAALSAAIAGLVNG